MGVPRPHDPHYLLQPEGLGEEHLPHRVVTSRSETKVALDVPPRIDLQVRPVFRDKAGSRFPGSLTIARFVPESGLNLDTVPRAHVD
jgi:hypothetical protein